MGSLFGTQKAPTPPTPPPVTVQDQINGVEQVPMHNPDGSITYITRALPLTAEQQAEKDQLDQIMKDSLAQIQALSASNYQPDAQTQAVLDQWQGVQQKLLDDQYGARSRGEEETLAKRGLTDSSAAQEVRRQRLLDEQQAEQNLNLQKDQMADQTRSDQLSLQQSLYNLAANSSNADAAKTAQAAANAQSQATALNNQRQASLLDYYTLQNQSANTASRVLSNPITGAGTLLGSLFKLF
jgi:hypothetical protein